MGSICPCIKSEDKDRYVPQPVRSSGERTPLLAHIPVERGPTPVSARSKQPDTTVPNDKEPNLEPIEIQKLGIVEIDKHFEVMDHAGLCNTYLAKYGELQKYAEVLGADRKDKYHGVRNTFETLRNAISEEALKHLALKRRYKYCMEIKYDGQFLDEDSLLKLQTFNKANHIIKELIDKKKALVDSVQLVIDSEDKIKRDVFVHCTDAKLQGKGPDLWKVCLENFKSLRKVTPAVEFINKAANELFDELVISVQILCKNKKDNIV